LTRAQSKYLTPTVEEAAELQRIVAARLNEGHGECIFEVGAEGVRCLIFPILTKVELESAVWTADEVDQAVEALQRIAASVDAEATILHVKWAQDDKRLAKTGFYCLIRRVSFGHVDKLIEVRVACCGNVDAGKSTCALAFYQSLCRQIARCFDGK
jgi:GTPase